MSCVKMFSYIPRKSPVHQLCGATKLIVFLAWTIVCMLTYDTRVLACAMLLGIIILRLARIKFKEVSTAVALIAVFMLLNTLAIYLFSPEEGVNIYGSRSVLFTITDRYTVTKEQLFYLLNVNLKYFTVVPVVLIFLCTTDPSEFASSLTRIGVNYKISYAVAISLRYIADVQQDYHNISQAQQARGVDLSSKVSLKKRVSGLASIAVPIIFTSLDRINLISNAMDLRGFGKLPKRTWYSERKFAKADWIVLAATVIISVAALYITFRQGSRYYNPFLGS